ncbi:hypothetical protein AVEN_136388-1 [Araneus ventricosus]|uniref:Uncharacterized protein n=1 Tax=Araneus ventricosus TaxID=182803 RepID=A0A4Y2TZX7_ARAVE|nr:hypothetical protein AVEN_136388-1 [Araneus ventricosus]
MGQNLPRDTPIRQFSVDWSRNLNPSVMEWRDALRGHPDKADFPWGGSRNLNPSVMGETLPRGHPSKADFSVGGSQSQPSSHGAETLPRGHPDKADFSMGGSRNLNPSVMEPRHCHEATPMSGFSMELGLEISTLKSWNPRHCHETHRDKADFRRLGLGLNPQSWSRDTATGHHYL